MNVLKRVLLSMVRKPAQMILMFLIVFVLGNVLFASVAIKQSSENVKKELRSRMPSTITIIKDDHLDNDFDVFEKMNQLMKSLKNDERIRDVEVNSALPVLKDHIYDIYYGIESLDDLPYFSIIEGRNYCEEDFVDDHPKIVAHIYNGDVHVGDTIDIPLFDYEVKHVETEEGLISYVDIKQEKEVYSFEVIGITDFTSDYFVPMKDIIKIGEKQKAILQAHDEDEQALFEECRDSLKYYMLIPRLQSAQISIDGLDMNEQLMNEIRSNENYLGLEYRIESTIEDYKYIQAPLENLIALANIALIAATILVIVMLSLVSMLFLRNRKQEIGIYMALGEKKSKVFSQFVCEILLVGLLATTLSLISSNKMASYVSLEFMKIQIDVDAEHDYQNKHQGMLTQLDLLDTYKVEFSAEYVASIYGISFVILLLSSAVPVLYMTKMNPKDSLM